MSAQVAPGRRPRCSTLQNHKLGLPSPEACSLLARLHPEACTLFMRHCAPAMRHATTFSLPLLAPAVSRLQVSKLK